ncbi:hypothetical protein NUW58_g10486 [Xylaria curta]|uniref:Uncharacterized protein n=1 Tax=Xylaria curta TaxID=42375 RepID=A0ACC1MK45_9PEZI|nr:hypothetical protein NUW58_g10486 [Xylaria curta]
MLNARGQENLTSRHPHGVAINQQQAWTSRQLGSKTPGTKFSKTPMRVPLNDENGAHAMTSKAVSRIDQSNFATPMSKKLLLHLPPPPKRSFAGYPNRQIAQRARAVLGDKTTNAKAKTIRTVNVKSVVKEIEESQAKLRNTVRAKQREAQAETQKLQVHSEGTDPLGGDRVEYCPPNPKNLPYTSDTLPDGALAFDALRPSHMMNGYYSYYFNPIEESGTSKRERQLQQETKNAIVEGRRKVKDDLENLEWSVKAELESDTKVVKKASTSTKLPAPRKPLSTVRSKNAANVLSMDDTTKSMQRKAAKTSELNKPVAKKSSSQPAN